MVGEDPSLDWQVLPEHEWCGIETEAMAWAEARLVELRAREVELWGGNLVFAARQDNGRRRVFLGQRGFRYSGEFAEVNLLRRLDAPVPESMVPAGYQVRAVAETGEIAARAAVHRSVGSEIVNQTLDHVKVA